MLTLLNWDQTTQTTFYVLDRQTLAIGVSLAFFPGQSKRMTVILHTTYNDRVGQSRRAQIIQATAIELGLSIFANDIFLVVDSSSLPTSNDGDSATL